MTRSVSDTTSKRPGGSYGEGELFELAFYALAAETPLHVMASRYFQDCTDYARDMKDLVDQCGAESVTLSKICGGFYFRDGTVPRGWRKNPGAVHYSPPSGSPVEEKYLHLQEPYTSYYVGHMSPVWKNLPGKPRIDSHVCQLGETFILALEKRDIDLIPPDLSPLKHSVQLSRSQLADMKAAAPTDDQKLFSLDGDFNPLDYSLPKQIALAPAFAVSAETRQKIEELQAYQNSTMGRIAETAKAIPYRVILGLGTIMSW